MKYYMLDNNGRILSETDESEVNHSPVLLEGPPDDGNIYKRVEGSWVIDQDAMVLQESLNVSRQPDIYGKTLTGDEDALTLARLAQIQTIKYAMRLLLKGVIGDLGDNIADVTRALVLAEGIRNGAITDENIIKGYSQYCQDMVDMYGGPQAILDVLNYDLQGLKTYLAPYYSSRDQTMGANDMGAVTEAAVNYNGNTRSKNIGQ
jgi:hypothetical protein